MKRFSILAGMAALHLAATACEGEAGVEAQEQSGDAAEVNGFDADKDASEKEVRGFVDQLYNAYNSGNPISYLNEPEIAFEPELASGLTALADEAEASGDLPPALGADPICGCQDWDNLSHEVESITIDGDRAVARLTVSNFGEPSARVLDLVKTPAGWRIYDIDGEFRGLVL